MSSESSLYICLSINYQKTVPSVTVPIVLWLNAEVSVLSEEFPLMVQLDLLDKDTKTGRLQLRHWGKFILTYPYLVLVFLVPTIFSNSLFKQLPLTLPKLS